MGDKAKDIWSKTKGQIGKLGKKIWVLVIAAVAVIGIVIGLVLWQNSSKDGYSVLFTGMTSEDMTSVTNYLAGEGITDYKISDMNTIMVPANQEPSLKAKLLMQGYPSSGFGYETYLKNVGSLSTESDRRTLYLYDLQDRLGAVIRCLDGVQDARVTITQGEDRRYVLGQDDVLKASAGVIVTMKGNEALSQKSANAIRSLVGSSVQGLEFEEISIVDTLGNTYDGQEVGSDASLADTKFALEEQTNNKIRKSILDVLTPMYGAENVSVGVNTTVEMSNAVEDSTTYDLPEWAADGQTNGEGIVGKKIWEGDVIQGEDEEGGVVGTQTNADLPTYVEEYNPDGTEKELHGSGEKDFLVDTTHTRRERMAGTVADVMVSVTINSNVPNTADPDALVGHVARAAGIDAATQADKISIISHPFYAPEDSIDNRPADTNPGTLLGILPDWVLYALAAGLLLFMMLTFLLLLLRRKKRNRIQLEEASLLDAIPSILPEEEISVQQPEQEPEGADIMEVHAERSMELRRGVREFAEQNPEIAAQMVKTWLKGDEDGNAHEAEA